MTYDQATRRLNRVQRFMATVYAMNTALLQRKIYSGPEHERLFVEWAAKELRRMKRRRSQGRLAPKRRERRAATARNARRAK